MKASDMPDEIKECYEMINLWERRALAYGKRIDSTPNAYNREVLRKLVQNARNGAESWRRKLAERTATRGARGVGK